MPLIGDSGVTASHHIASGLMVAALPPAVDAADVGRGVHEERKDILLSGRTEARGDVELLGEEHPRRALGQPRAVEEGICGVVDPCIMASDLASQLLMALQCDTAAKHSGDRKEESPRA